MHKLAEPAALAAIAAQNQGKFWQMHDALFGAGKLTQQSIEAAALGTGLDMEKFKKGYNFKLPLTNEEKENRKTQKSHQLKVSEGSLYEV